MEQEKFNILLVENNPVFQERFRNTIAGAIKSRIDIAEDGAVARNKIFGPIRPDLILLDLELPDVEGIDLLTDIRQEHAFDGIPVICITAANDYEGNMEALESKADDIISRDASPGIIIARIKTQMRHKLALDRLNRMAIDRDLFAAGILHDIRNIETTISIVCEFTAMKLQRDPAAFKNEIDQNLDSLIRSVSKLGTYATDVIRTVRATERTMEVQPQDIGQLLDWATDIMTSKASDNQIETIRWKPLGPLLPVLGDAEFLKLAIFNLVQNSVKYKNPAIEQKLEVSQVVMPAIENPARSRIVTRIRDYGVGVKKGELKKIFEPFKRGSDQVKGTGFGLGLSMVATVIGRMGGKVWAELPEAGPGIVMCIDLPGPENIASDAKQGKVIV